jgi:hypothetical protein
MSEYLWDKTGEADAEVERLEELLGGLRHRPSAFELPAEMQTRPHIRSRVFRPAWLAFAAALLLAILAGALVALRHNAPDAGKLSAAQPPRQTPPHSPPQVSQPAGGANSTPAPEPEEGGRQAASQDASDRQGRRQSGRRAANGKRVRRLLTPASDGSGEHEEVAGTTAGGAREDESAALESRGREAKEQLVYALRLTSYTLKEVQRKTQGADNARPAFDERERIK